MEKLEPFADEETVIEIGKLTIENRLDRIAMYGSLDLTKDKEGLQMARELHPLLANVVKLLSKLEANGDLPEKVQLIKPGVVKNPFA
jgi:hypothetical protein